MTPFLGTTFYSAHISSVRAQKWDRSIPNSTPSRAYNLQRCASAQNAPKLSARKIDVADGGDGGGDGGGEGGGGAGRREGGSAYGGRHAKTRAKSSPSSCNGAVVVQPLGITTSSCHNLFECRTGDAVRAGSRSNRPTTAPNPMPATPRAAHRSSLAAVAKQISFELAAAFLLRQGALTRRATLRLPRTASATRRDGPRVAFESIPHPAWVQNYTLEAVVTICAQFAIGTSSAGEP